MQIYGAFEDWNKFFWSFFNYLLLSNSLPSKRPQKYMCFLPPQHFLQIIFRLFHISLIARDKKMKIFSSYTPEHAPEGAKWTEHYLKKGSKKCFFLFKKEKIVPDPTLLFSKMKPFFTKVLFADLQNSRISRGFEL